MPVIVPEEAFDFWLDTGNVDAATAAALIAPAPDEALECFEVSTAVNRVANDFPALVEAVRATAQGSASPAVPEKPAGGGQAPLL
jgi:putative SOS response-associated peptidase YedK